MNYEEIKEHSEWIGFHHEKIAKLRDMQKSSKDRKVIDAITNQIYFIGRDIAKLDNRINRLIMNNQI